MAGGNVDPPPFFSLAAVTFISSLGEKIKKIIISSRKKAGSEMAKSIGKSAQRTGGRGGVGVFFHILGKLFYVDPR